MKNICYVYIYSINISTSWTCIFLPPSQGRIGLLARCAFLSLTNFSGKNCACIRFISSIFCHIGISFIFFKKIPYSVTGSLATSGTTSTPATSSSSDSRARRKNCKFIKKEIERTFCLIIIFWTKKATIGSNEM